MDIHIMFLYVGLAVCGIALLIPFVMLIRNDCVFRVRIAVINMDDRGTYDRLPTYGEMLYSPRYWRLWTVSQWRAYVASKYGEEVPEIAQ